MPLLSQDETQKIVEAISSSGLDVMSSRGVLLQHINPAYTGLLAVNAVPMVQLMGDLNRMNQVERLSDGQVPLAIYLRNVALLLSGLEEQKVVLKALSEVEQRSTGSPRVDLSAMPETKEKIIHSNDLLPYRFMERGWKTAASVVKLRVPRIENGQERLNHGKPMVYHGTGWLLASSLIMTNHHVVNARGDGQPDASEADLRGQAMRTIAHFDYDADDLAGLEVTVTALEAWDKDLDFALLRIPASGRAALRCGLLPLGQDTAQVALNIVQHPGGRSKSYAIRNNLLSAATDTELRYFTDTEPGSSGSPVLNDSWEVVALHRASAYATGLQYLGKDTAFVNVGTRISAILGHLQARHPALAAEII